MGREKGTQSLPGDTVPTPLEPAPCWQTSLMLLSNCLNSPKSSVPKCPLPIGQETPWLQSRYWPFLTAYAQMLVWTASCYHSSQMDGSPNTWLPQWRDEFRSQSFRIWPYYGSSDMCSHLLFMPCFYPRIPRRTYQGASVGGVWGVILEVAGKAKVGHFADQVTVDQNVPSSQIPVHVVHLSQVLHASSDAPEHPHQLDYCELSIILL